MWLSEQAQLEEANKELEDFVYSVSHDLRAPLRSISGFAEIIDRRHKASLNEEGRHYFDNIVKASRQMGELIDDLLKFSRLGRMSIKSEKVPLNDVLKTAMETLSDQIKKTGCPYPHSRTDAGYSGRFNTDDPYFYQHSGKCLKIP